MRVLYNVYLCIPGKGCACMCLYMCGGGCGERERREAETKRNDLIYKFLVSS